MNTIGWVFIIIAIVLIRAVSHGHLIDENGKFVLLQRVTDEFTGIITGKPPIDTPVDTGILSPTPAVEVPQLATGSNTASQNNTPSVLGWAQNPNSVDSALAYAEKQRQSGMRIWPRRCLAFVARAYGLVGSGSLTARSLWNAIPTNMKSSASSGMPTGALMFYAPNHVALYAGNGQVYSTDILRWGAVDKVNASEITNGKWHLQYLGWTPPYFPNNSNSKRVSGV